MPDADVVLLENLRFSKDEERARASFARRLAALGHVYVNDDFSTAHRPHASVALVPRLLPSFAGMNLLSEMKALDRLRLAMCRQLELPP